MSTVIVSHTLRDTVRMSFSLFYYSVVYTAHYNMCHISHSLYLYSLSILMIRNNLQWIYYSRGNNSLNYVSTIALSNTDG